MEVTKESRRVLWIVLLLTWVVVAAVSWKHAAEFDRNRRMLDRSALRGAVAPTTPMKRVLPTMYADTQMWVRNATAAAEGDGPRIRRTENDNAPYGREVHWTTGFTWLIAGPGWLIHQFTGRPVAESIEAMVAWFNVPFLMAFVVGFTIWVGRRAGAGAAVFLAAAMIGHDAFYSGFNPTYVDHHGLLAALVLGVLLGAILMGLGFWRDQADGAQFLPRSLRTARRAAVVSAVCGAVGLWESAATLIPAIAIVGGAGALAILGFGRTAVVQHAVCAPGVWRLWGRLGAALSLAFYLLEYFPSQLGLRLEVNHPAYALAWWGGAELIAQLAEWRIERRTPRWRWSAAAAGAVLVAPVLIALGGARVFVVFDPFITRLNAEYVAEAISVRRAIELMGSARFLGEFIWMGVSLLAAVVAWWRSRPADRIVVAFCTLAGVAYTAMALKQLRWAPSASAAQICLVLLALASFAAHRPRWARWAAVGVMVLALGVPFTALRLRVIMKANAARAVDRVDALQPLYRDIAATLRASQPEGAVTLLASPNASVAIGYHGQFKAIGTLYWENLDGTKAAAAMFSAQTESEARRLIRSRGVTHVVMVSEENFLAEYFSLLALDPQKATLQQSFGRKLLVDLEIPFWLEPLPYDMPRDLPFLPARVLLLRTRFEADPAAEALYEEALEEFQARRLTAGETKLDQALARAPQAAEFWVTKTNLLLSRRDIAGAKAAVEKALGSVDERRRFTLCSLEGARFYQAGAHGLAVQLFRIALADRSEASTANNLAWILATSRDDGVRNGAEALRITRALAGGSVDLVVLNSHAAALAETGQFAEAVQVAGRAVEAVRKLGDPAALRLAQARLTKYQSGQPWRE